MFNGRRQPSNDGTSRMTRECQVRFCERLGVQFPGAYSAKREAAVFGLMSAFTSCGHVVAKAYCC